MAVVLWRGEPAPRDVAAAIRAAGCSIARRAPPDDGHDPMLVRVIATKHASPPRAPAGPWLWLCRAAIRRLGVRRA